MTPIQQLMLGVGGAKKTYIDDVFSTNVYTGTSSSTGSGTTQAINTGFDLASEGGLVWNKGRSFSDNHFLIDTVRGANKLLRGNTNGAESTYSLVNAFTSTGYTTTDDVGINGTGKTHASWSFRKAPGFFDVVTYTGNATARTISHSLGSIPGCIMIKRLDQADYWAVYHRGNADSNNAGHYFLKLNENSAKANGDTRFNDTEPTASVFSIGNSDAVNANNGTYVAYLFAGGESAAATARSVDFDGNDYLTIADSADWDLGQTFTIEAWVKLDALNNYNVIISQDSNSPGWYMSVNSNGQCEFYDFNGGEQVMSSVNSVGKGMWTHIAFVANSGTGQWYINGTKSGSSSSMNVQGGSSDVVYVGAQLGPNWYVDGKISNLRVVKGTAVYTSSFRPPTEPLTNITNTKLLCCNNSSTTGSTVTPGTITATGSPIASTESPFDDPAGFKFGDSKEGVIKCGSYVGNGSATGPKINLGWEPQYLLIKRIDSASHWYVLDSMRGFTDDGVHDVLLSPNQNNASDGNEWVDDYYGISSTGFNPNTTSATFNANSGKYIYMAIRRPDGYVGKQYGAGEGTSVFSMDAPNSNTTGPIMESPFPVDFGLLKVPTSLGTWYASARLIQGEFLETDSSAAGSSYGNFPFDYQNGWVSHSSYNVYQSWMWKRHAGFDVVTYDGQNTFLKVPHSLSKTPEMIWIKCRSGQYAGNQNWKVYHKGLNGGTTPQNYFLSLNGTGAESTNANTWNNTAPTSTHFTVGNGGNDAEVSLAAHTYIAMLFASIPGVSKCGFYDGSSSSQTITTGFQPRFLIIKDRTGSGNWFVLDTTRGWGSGNDNYLALDSNAAQAATDFGAPTSTGFTLVSGGGYNANGSSYIYYAHA